MRGRKPIPTAIKELNGNPGKRALNSSEPKPTVRIPSCPPQLQGEARKEWRRIGKELATHGLLTDLDRTALAAYCTAYERWLQAEENVRKLGAVVKSPSGFPIQNPYLAIANKAMEQMSKLLTEFGCTPSSRARVAGNKPASPADDLAAFLTD